MDDRNQSSSHLINYVRALENMGNYARGEQLLQTLVAMELEPFIQTWQWPRLRNIVVDFMPNPRARRLLFSAHYDAVKGSPGANDNASGVAVLLGLCKELKGKLQPVRVAFFDREEAWLRTPVFRLGLLGSLYYVLRTSLRNVSAIYNLEFCGQGDFLGIWPVKGKEIHLKVVKQIEIAALRLGLPFKSVHIPWQLLSSDHLSFRLKGFSNAVTLSLLPTSQVSLLEKLLENISLAKLLTGWRPVVPEPLARIHGKDDTSSYVDESSLQLMLSLLLELVKAMGN